MSNEYKDYLLDMSDEERANYELYMKYPFLAKPYEDVSYEYFPVLIPDGWKNLFIDMCEELKNVLNKINLKEEFYLVEVKEKYSRLVCYANTYIPEAEEIFTKYSKLSANSCIHCGNTKFINSICTECNMRWLV